MLQGFDDEVCQMGHIQTKAASHERRPLREGQGNRVDRPINRSLR